MKKLEKVDLPPAYGRRYNSAMSVCNAVPNERVGEQLLLALDSCNGDATLNPGLIAALRDLDMSKLPIDIEPWDPALRTHPLGVQIMSRRAEDFTAVHPDWILEYVIPWKHVYYWTQNARGRLGAVFVDEETARALSTLHALT